MPRAEAVELRMRRVAAIVAVLIFLPLPAVQGVGPQATPSMVEPPVIDPDAPRIPELPPAPRPPRSGAAGVRDGLMDPGDLAARIAQVSGDPALFSQPATTASAYANAASPSAIGPQPPYADPPRSPATAAETTATHNCVDPSAACRREWTRATDGNDEGFSPGADFPQVLVTTSTRVFTLMQTTGGDGQVHTGVLAHDAETGERLWDLVYDGPTDLSDWPNDIVASPDGSRVYVSISSPGVIELPLGGTASSGSDGVLLALDAASGSLAWEVRYNGEAPLGVADEEFIAIDIAPDGSNLYVAGPAWTTETQEGDPTLYGAADLFVASLQTSDGAFAWTRLIDDTTRISSELVTDISVTSGHVVITGYEGTDEGMLATISAFRTSTGASAWAAQIDSPSTDIFWDVSIHEGRAYASGVSTECPACDANYLVAAYDLETGQRMWLVDSLFTGGDRWWTYFTGFHALSADGSTLVLAASRGSAASATDVWLPRIDAATGAILGEATYDSPDHGYENVWGGLVSLPDGSIAILGTSWRTATDYDTLHLLLSPDGTLARAQVVDQGNALGDVGWAIGVSPDGSRTYHAIASSAPGTLLDTLVVARSASVGTPLWSDRFDGVGISYDRSDKVVASPDGSTLYQTILHIGVDYWLIGGGSQSVAAVEALDAVTGARLWRAQHLERFQWIQALAISPSGDTVVVASYYDAGGDWASRVEALDAASGSVRFTRQTEHAQPQALAFDAATGDLYAAGFDSDRYVYGRFGNVTIELVDVATGAPRWATRVFTGYSIVDGLDLVLAKGRAHALVAGRIVNWQAGDRIDMRLLSFDTYDGGLWYNVRYLPEDYPSGDRGTYVPIGLDVSPDGNTLHIVAYRTRWPGYVYWDIDWVVFGIRAADGEQLWKVKQGTNERGSENPSSLIVDRRTGVVVATGNVADYTGWQAGDDPRPVQMTTVAYDPTTGDELWSETYVGETFSNFGWRAVAAPGGDRVYIAGFASHPSGGIDVFIHSRSTLTGALVFAERYDSGGLRDIMSGLTLSPRGDRIYLVGFSDTTDAASDATIHAFFVTRAPSASLLPNATLAREPASFSFATRGVDTDGGIAGWTLDTDTDGKTDIEGNGPPPASIQWQYPRAGSYAVRLDVRDVDGAIASTTTSVSVRANAAPIIDLPAQLAVSEGSTLDIFVPADDPDGDPITLTAADVPAGASFDTASRRLRWTPGETDTGFYAGLKLRASDGILTTIHPVTLRVLGVNQPPVPRPIAPIDQRAGALLTLLLAADDVDGDVTTFRPVSVPVGSAFDPASARLSWRPMADQVGEHVLQFSVTDGVESVPFEVRVRVISNRAPIVMIEAPLRAEAGESIVFGSEGTFDPDQAGAMTYAWDLDASDGIELEGNEPTVSHRYRRAGNHVVTLTVTDAEGATATRTAIGAVDDNIAMNVTLVGDRVRLNSRPTFLVSILRDDMTPGTDAELRFTLVHVATGRVLRTASATTDARGSALITLETDLATGTNLPGEHILLVDATSSSREGAPFLDEERASSEVRYSVEVER